MENAGPEQDQAPLSAPRGPVWRFLIQPKWLGWHVFMVVSFWGMLWLGDWQFHRAMSGNPLSWAYTFEWPLFSGFAVVFWARTIRDEFRERRGQALAPRAYAAQVTGLPASMIVGSVQSATAGQDADEDAEVSAYNAYLTRLNDQVKDRGRRR
jgi:hypothetical protein